jgi:hypothetical protein
VDSLDWTHDQRFPLQGHILNVDGDALSTCLPSSKPESVGGWVS